MEKGQELATTEQLVKSNLLAKRSPFKEPTDFPELLVACDILVKSKILPKEIDTKEKAAVVALTGRELGLQLMASMRGIYIVNNKPSLSAQMMLALAFNTGELEDYQINESGRGEAAVCEVIVKRKGKAPYSYTFNIDMIKKMRKYDNEWLKQPENMCKQRALSGNLRVTFPDAILGMYTPEEAASIEDAQVIDQPVIGLKSDKDKGAPPSAPEAAPAKPPAGEGEVVVFPTEKWNLGNLERFGGDIKKVESMAGNVKRAHELLGDEKFMDIVGGIGVEHVSQIVDMPTLVKLVNALLEKVGSKE